MAFWTREIKFSKRSLAVTLLGVFLLSAIICVIFINYIFPRFTGLPGLSILAPRSPVIINRTEEIRINEGINIREVYDRIRDVSVTVLSTGSVSGFEKSDLATGIIVTSDGVILTTKSSVGDLEVDGLRVITSRGDVYPATVLAFDPRSELAMLKISVSGLPSAVFGDSTGLVVGDKLVGVFEGVSRGEAPSEIFDYSHRSRQATDYPAIVSSDFSAEFLGASPAIEREDEMVIFANRDSQIVGFGSGENIMPGEHIQQAVDNFLSNDGFSRPALGIHYSYITPVVAELLDLPADYGVLVRGGSGQPAIVQNSAASAAGLKENDFIYKINNVELDGKNTLERALNAMKAGDLMRIDFYRGDIEMSVSIKLKAIE